MKGWADSRLNVTLVSCLLDLLPLHKSTQELLMIPTFKHELWSPRTDKKEYLRECFVEKESIAYHFPEKSHGIQEAYNHYYWSRSSGEGERSLLICHNTTWVSVIVMEAKQWASHSSTGLIQVLLRQTHILWHWMETDAPQVSPCSFITFQTWTAWER